MRILIVSYYAEAHLYSSSAQMVHSLARGLVERGEEVRVVCAGAYDDTLMQDGYPLTRIPISSPLWEKRWLGAWRADERIRTRAKDYLDKWRPDVIFLGAWKQLTEFAFEAAERDIPIVQFVYDYSIICLQHWLMDSWGNVCTGPSSLSKCTACVKHRLGWKTRAKYRLFAAPIAGTLVRKYAPNHIKYREKIHVGTVIREASSYMERYRKLVSLYIAPAPAVIDVLASVGISPKRCRFVRDFIGREKLSAFPRAGGTPGVDRPIRFLYVGRWSPEKGPELLLEAFLSAEIRQKAELWIVSTNAVAEQIQGIARGRLGINKTIKVLNDIQGAQVSKVLAQTDLCVVPSTCVELASRVVLEAHAQNVPVVASSTVGNRYVIEKGVNGEVFPVGNLGAIAECLERVSSEPGILIKWSRNTSTPIGEGEWIGSIVEILKEACETKVDQESSETVHGLNGG